MAALIGGLTLLATLTALMMWNERQQQKGRDQRAREALAHAQEVITSAVAEAARYQVTEEQRADWHYTQVQRAAGRRRDIETASRLYREKEKKTNWQKEGF